MGRRINMRQVEAFKAFVETGTTTATAEILGVTQPAISKLLQHLEIDTGLTLLDRSHGRLVVTPLGKQLYQEIDRIFVGLRQIDRAVERIRQEHTSRLVIGVMPALAGAFFRRVACDFMNANPNIRLSVSMRSTPLLVDWVANGQMDLSLVSDTFDSPRVTTETFLTKPLVCIMPPGHELAGRHVIRPDDLRTYPFISFFPNTAARNRIDSILKDYDLEGNTVAEVSASSMVCELVTGGMGVALVHPLLAYSYGDRLIMRPFEPALSMGFVLCQPQRHRNAAATGAFLRQLRLTARAMSDEIGVDVSPA